MRAITIIWDRSANANARMSIECGANRFVRGDNCWIHEILESDARLQQRDGRQFGELFLLMHGNQRAVGPALVRYISVGFRVHDHTQAHIVAGAFENGNKKCIIIGASFCIGQSGSNQELRFIPGEWYPYSSDRFFLLHGRP